MEIEQKPQKLNPKNHFLSYMLSSSPVLLEQAKEVSWFCMAIKFGI